MTQIHIQPKMTEDLMLARGDHDMKVIKPIQVGEEVHEKRSTMFRSRYHTFGACKAMY
jgi:hypothetical protein